MFPTQLPSKIKALRTKINEREKLKTAYGVWFVTHDDLDICYGVLVDESYPERTAFSLVQKLRDRIRLIDHCEYETEENIKRMTKEDVAKLFQTFSDPAKVDKLSKATNEVKMLEGELSEGIKKLVTNQESLSEMDDKASQMRSYAQQFQQSSEKLERMLYWRNMRLKILIALGVIGLLGFGILIVVQVTRGNSSSTTPNTPTNSTRPFP